MWACKFEPAQLFVVTEIKNGKFQFTEEALGQEAGDHCHQYVNYIQK